MERHGVRNGDAAARTADHPVGPNGGNGQWRVQWALSSTAACTAGHSVRPANHMGSGELRTRLALSSVAASTADHSQGLMENIGENGECDGPALVQHRRARCHVLTMGCQGCWEEVV